MKTNSERLSSLDSIKTTTDVVDLTGGDADDLSNMVVEDSGSLDGEDKSPSSETMRIHNSTVQSSKSAPYSSEVGVLSEEEEEEEVVQVRVVHSVPDGNAYYEQQQHRQTYQALYDQQPYHMSSLSAVAAPGLPMAAAPTMQPLKRQLPASWGGEDGGLAPAAKHHQPQHEITQHMYSFGQEFSFTVLDKREIEARWTGSGRPDDKCVRVVNHFFHKYGNANQRDGKPLFGVLPNSSDGKHLLAMHVSLYAQFENALRQHGIGTDPIPEAVLAALSIGHGGGVKKGAGSMSGFDETTEEGTGRMAFLRQNLPASLLGSLADFQKVGVEWGANEMDGRCLIADEPGLGKTIQAITAKTVD